MTKHRWTRLLALSVTVAALALPSAAAAAPAEQILGPTAAPVESSSVSAPSVTSSDSGFSWGDGALGAGAALAVVAISVGGALMLRSVRAERREVRLTS